MLTRLFSKLSLSFYNDPPTANPPSYIYKNTNAYKFSLRNASNLLIFCAENKLSP